MRAVNYTLVCTIFFGAASIAGFASRAEAARMKPEDKYAILEKCEADARLANPDNGSARYTAYAACMKKQGLKPTW